MSVVISKPILRGADALVRVPGHDGRALSVVEEALVLVGRGAVAAAAAVGIRPGWSRDAGR